MEENKLINPNFDKHGYIQVYTGNGKGKTTASLGLTMRALGRGWNVLILMFTKGGNDYGELNSFCSLSQVISNKLKIIQAGTTTIPYKNSLSQESIKRIQEGWKIAKIAISSNKYKLVVLDEINIAIDLKIIDISDVINTLKNKPEDIEIVLTGRNADEKIINLADLVSEIKPIKHYWDKGIQARKGIEY